MISPYQCLQSVSNNSVKFAFYSSKGELFAYGNATQGLTFFSELGEKADYHGELPKTLPAERLEPEDKTEYITRFLMALWDLQQAYELIAKLTPEEE